MRLASDKTEILKEYFGYDEFRKGQEELIDAVLNGRDVLGVMPTGAGKSLCYQIPALLFSGITLVISPLISLMKDQVSALTHSGAAAAYINSSLSAEQLTEVFRRANAGEYKIIYVAPERLETGRFARLAENREISFIAVDEAHCVSQWGQDFRPSYLKIPDFIATLPYRPVIGAYTATATQAVKLDVTDKLGLNSPLSIATGFDRENLFFDVIKPKNKLQALLALVAERRDSGGIIYCSTRSAVERVCEELNKRGCAAVRYHAGLSDAERRENQEAFICDSSRVMVATNAFGMGIDKSNVGYVIHYNMPKNLESYYQEAGRAGRDGTHADCILLFSAADINTAKFLIESSEESEAQTAEEQAENRRRNYQRLESMVEYCKTNGCYRNYILNYFGESRDGACGNCGNCKGQFTERDITTEAKMILSCIARVGQMLPYSIGASMYVMILRGSKSQRVESMGLTALTTYGILRDTDAATLGAYIDRLCAEGCIACEAGKYPTLRLGEHAGEVLFRDRAVTVRIKKSDAPERQKSRSRAVPDTALGEGSDLLSALKSLRAALARAEGVPAYIVFTNAALEDMANRAPRTMAEFMQVSGVGEKKAARYGQQFLAAINDYSPD
ncbi:MAG: DNA helicase RecQ [Oscillospiraceae bacterium]